MAIIKNCYSGEILFLNNKHVFGCNVSCYTTAAPIADVGISANCATIYWDSGAWYIKDHSKNGIFLNNLYVHNTTAILSNGSHIQFGEDISTKWEIINLLPPASYIKCINQKNKQLELRSCVSIPSDEKGEVSFCLSKDDRWIMKRNNVVSYLTDGAIIKLHNEEWQFFENETTGTAHFIPKQSLSFFQFNLSIDEEHINVKIVTNGAEVDLGYRSHNYLLLALARKKVKDMRQKYDLHDQGWLSMETLQNDVAKEIGKEIDEYYLNLQIYRLRKQLEDIRLNGYDFSNVIERRKREIRFAHPYMKIIKDNKITGEIMPINEIAAVSIGL